MISIIGPAGKTKDVNNSNLTRTLYFRALEYLKGNIEDKVDITLKSGGAAWCDHLAVSLYLESKNAIKLELALPCNFENDKFQDNGSTDWRINPGRLANYYHQK